MARRLLAVAALLAIAHSERVPVRIGLTQQNLDQAYNYVVAVSDPSSSTYGRHWSKEQVENAFRPRPDAAAAVLSYLTELGIEDAEVTPSGYWIALSATRDQAEILERAPQAHHPAIRKHIEYVSIGTNAQAHPRSLQARTIPFKKFVQQPAVHWTAPPGYSPPPSYDPSDLSNCATNTTPPCIRALYGIPEEVTPLKTGEIGVFETAQSYAQEDLDLFYTHYAPHIPNGTHPILESVNGAKAPVSPSEASSEAELDFQTVYGLLGASNISFFDISTPANLSGSFTNYLDAFLDAVDSSFCTTSETESGFQCGGAQLSKVLSVSYSQPELAGASLAAQVRVCNEFMKLSLQGHTILVSSGDYGVAANPLFGDELCINNGCFPTNYHDNSATAHLNGTIFMPQFPSNCPYVLTVGATMPSPGTNGVSSESAMNLPKTGAGECDSHVVFSSGGGFANYFARPDYQAESVATYFAEHDPGYKYYNASGQDIDGNSSNVGQNDGIYARNGRGIPDVSAIGTSFMIYINGTLSVEDGTSASAPVWASIVALLNQKREAAGKSPVGFINPTLYEHSEIFHDVVSGNNPGCETQGFEAVPGWDPVTGLGTPDFEKMVEVFLGLP